MALACACALAWARPAPDADPATLRRAWDGLLAKYVARGKVDYRAWRARDTAALDRYLHGLAALPKAALARAGREESLATCLDTYNAYTVRLILRHPGVASIRDIAGGQPWKLRAVALAGDTLSLDDLENRVLRPRFRDPRIHFALVCASRGCPPLPSRAFFPATLDSALSARARAFLADTARNRFAGPVTGLSQLFNWYSDDFRAYPGGLAGFLSRYAPDGYSPSKPVEYLPYDWRLNGDG